MPTILVISNTKPAEIKPEQIDCSPLCQGQITYIFLQPDMLFFGPNGVDDAEFGREVLGPKYGITDTPDTDIAEMLCDWDENPDEVIQREYRDYLLSLIGPIRLAAIVFDEGLVPDVGMQLEFADAIGSNQPWFVMDHTSRELVAV